MGQGVPLVLQKQQLLLVMPMEGFPRECVTPAESMGLRGNFRTFPVQSMLHHSKTTH